MEFWIGVAGLALGGTGIGGLIGAFVALRRAKDQHAEALAVIKQSGEHTLIDQLQEELREHRIAATRRADSQDERLNRLDRQHDVAREHIHELRSHIWEGKPPPPPAWPEGLPR